MKDVSTIVESEIERLDLVSEHLILCGISQGAAVGMLTLLSDSEPNASWEALWPRVAGSP